jgi:hypothetical protein
MGVWSTSISGNDEFKVIYDTFRELYCEHDGKKWLYELPAIKRRMAETFSFQLENEDVADEFWFAQAKAFWDYGINDDSAFKKVKKIISSGSNLEVWKRLGAKEKDIPKRKKVLDDFLDKLSQPNSKPVKRGKIVKAMPPFSIGDLLTFQDDKGNYYGAVVTHAYHDTKGTSVVHLLNYCSDKKPGKEELMNAALMENDKEIKEYEPDGWGNRNWNNIYGFRLSAKGYKQAKQVFEKIGEVEFHQYGYFKDGLKSFADMMKYDWDILPAFAALNYQKGSSGKDKKALLSYYTTETDISDKEVAAVINAFKKNKPATVLSQKFNPEEMSGWFLKMSNDSKVSVNIYMKGFNKTNTFLTNNILSRVFGVWLKTIGCVLDDFYFRVEDDKGITEDDLKYYKKLGVTIADWKIKIKEK